MFCDGEMSHHTVSIGIGQENEVRLRDFALSEELPLYKTQGVWDILELHLLQPTTKTQYALGMSLRLPVAHMSLEQN